MMVLLMCHCSLLTSDLHWGIMFLPGQSWEDQKWRGGQNTAELVNWEAKYKQTLKQYK